LPEKFFCDLDHFVLLVCYAININHEERDTMNNEFLKGLDEELTGLIRERRELEANGQNTQDVKEEIRNIRRLIRAELIPA